jgi:hypothetical protein
VAEKSQVNLKSGTNGRGNFYGSQNAICLSWFLKSGYGPNMGQSEIQKLEMEVMCKVEAAKRDLRAHEAEAAEIGETLEKFGKVLQDCPESITPLPEIDAPDFRNALNLLNPDTRQKVVRICRGIREMQVAYHTAKKRKAALGF